MQIKCKVKKNLLCRLLVLVIVALPLNVLRADNVDSSSAKAVAAAFAYCKNIPGSPQLVATLNSGHQSEAGAYIYNISDGGFVIVAANDCVKPIIAYSHQGHLDIHHLPPAFISYLHAKVDEVAFAQRLSLVAPANVSLAWSRLLNPASLKRRVKSAEYLLTTTWDQNWPYNMYCPVIDETTAPVGCVATAMSQIIRFWNHPVNGTGSSTYFCSACADRLTADYENTTYDYDNMPDYLTYESSDVEKDAVATLCYHVGVSLMMRYGSTSSGVSMSHVGGYVSQALVNYFKYDSTTNYHNRGEFSDEYWVDTIRREIEDGRPVLYAGYDAGNDGSDAGHAFVLDGYDDETGYFHVNWGWSGGGDGWFDLYNSDLDVYGYHFSSAQVAVLGIKPRVEPDPDTVSISLIDSSSNLLSVYPNPSSSYITVSCLAHHPTQLRIMTITGNIVESQPITSGSHSLKIDVSNYPRGIYFCAIGGYCVKFVVR